MKTEYKYKCYYLGWPILELQTGNASIWVQKKGKFLPVALIELTPYSGYVHNFRLSEAELEDMKEDFRRCTGYSI